MDSFEERSETRPDWFLMGIVAGVLVLIVIVLAMAARQQPPAYSEDGAPEGVTHDYLVALAMSDFERAWLLLSPEVPGYPSTLEQFVDDIADKPWTFALHEPSRAFSVSDASIAGNRAVVVVTESTFRQQGLFDSNQWTREFTVTLERDGGTWRILRSDRYWHRCWSKPPPCERHTRRGDTNDPAEAVAGNEGRGPDSAESAGLEQETGH